MIYSCAVEDAEANNAIHKLVDKVFWGRLSIRNNKGINYAGIKVSKSSYEGIVYTLIALVLGILRCKGFERCFCVDTD